MNLGRQIHKRLRAVLQEDNWPLCPVLDKAKVEQGCTKYGFASSRDAGTASPPTEYRARFVYRTGGREVGLQQRLVKTGGRLVKHARYYWLLLAEGHLTRQRFGSMLRMIAALPLPDG